MNDSSFDYIIPIITTLSALLMLTYSIALSIKRKRTTFYVSIAMSLSFFLLSLLEIIFLLKGDQFLLNPLSSLPLFLVIAFWGITLYFFDKDLKQKFGSVTLQDIQRIEKTEKEYLLKMFKKKSKRGGSLSNISFKSDEKKLTEPFFIDVKKPIFLIGMKEVGKSTIGRIISTKLNLNFIDSDDLMLKVIYPKYQSLKQYYNAVGPQLYIKLEADCLYNYFKNNADPVVIALGGGVCENPSAIKIAANSGTIIFLDMEKEALYKRIERHQTTPAFVDKFNPEESFMKVYEQRTHEYKTYANITVKLNEAASPQANAYRVLKGLEEYSQIQNAPSKEEEGNNSSTEYTTQPQNILRLKKRPMPLSKSDIANQEDVPLK